MPAAPPLPAAAPSLPTRLAGILRLDDAAYRAAAADPRANRQAAAVGLAAALATGVGSATPDDPLGGFLGGAAQGLIWWLTLTVAVAFVGNLAARGAPRPERDAVYRVVGLAQAPHLLLLLGAVPAVGLVASALATLGGLLTVLTGVRTLWGRSLWWALAVGVVAFAVAFVVSTVLVDPFR